MKLIPNIDTQTKKLLLYFAVPYICIILIIFMFDIINYRSAMFTIENQTINSTYSNLKGNIDKLSQKISEINETTLQFNSDPSIIAAAENPALDSFEAKKLQKKLGAHRGTSPLIGEILLYFPASGVAVSDTKAFYMNDKSDLIACDNMTYEEFKADYLEVPYSHTFVTLKGFRYLSPVGKDTHCVISSLPIGEAVSSVQVLFMLSTGELESIISDLGHEHAFVNVINNGNYLLAENPAFPPELFDGIDGYQLRHNQGEQYFLFNLETEHIPFRVVAAISREEILKEANLQRNSTYIILLLSILIALVIAAVFVKNHAKRTKTIIDENQELLSKFESNKPYIASEFLKGLFLNEIPSLTEIDRIMEELDIPLSVRGNYAVLLIQDEHRSADTSQYTRDLFLHKFIIQNVLTELVPQAVSCEVSFDSMCFILPFETCQEEAVQRQIEEIFDTIDNVLVQDVNYNLKYACGTCIDSLDRLSLSFFDAKNQIAAQKSAELELDVGTDGVYYPLELEASLINAVSTGNDKSVESIFTLIENANRQVCAASQLMTYLSGTLRRIIKEKKAMIPEHELESFACQAADLHECKQLFIRLCEYTSTNTPPLLHKIMQYIDASFQNTQLSRTNVAKEFHITEEYISMLFKRYENSTFLNYVDQVRVHHAQTLLRENPGMSLEQIAYACGYSNAISFRRAFKKITNTVPSEFRKQQ